MRSCGCADPQPEGPRCVAQPKVVGEDLVDAEPDRGGEAEGVDSSSATSSFAAAEVSR